MGCRPRRRGVPLRRPVSSTPSSVRRSSALNAERAHFCARPSPARFWFPYAGMPDLVVRPAKSDLRLKMALPGGLGPPACGLGNRRSVLVSYGSLSPRKTPGLARAHCGTAASAHNAHGVRTDGLLRDPDVVVYGEEFCEAPSRGELSGASFGRPWLCTPIRFPCAV